jgi:hypothetical protein
MWLETALGWKFETCVFVPYFLDLFPSSDYLSAQM